MQSAQGRLAHHTFSVGVLSLLRRLSLCVTSFSSFHEIFPIIHLRFVAMTPHMIRYKCILFYAIAVVLFVTQPNTSIGMDDEKRLDHFLRVAEELRVRLRVPGAGLGIVVDNQIHYIGGIGYRDVKNRLPVTEDTLFAIGSNTKSFTGFLVTKLASENKLTWDQPIAEYIPDLQLSDPYVAKHVNLADACSHMTGLARQDGLWKGKSITRRQVFDQIKSIPFQSSLREAFNYNNHMYVVVGAAIESAAETSWENCVRNRIFKRLGMTDSYVTYREFMDHPQRSLGYDADGKTLVPHVNVDNIGPAGSISCTPRDFMKWMMMWANQGKFDGRTVLSDEELSSYVMPRSASMAGPNEVKSYWAGWGLKILDGQVQFIHSGGIDGQNSRILVRPADGFGVFVLANQRTEYKELLIDYAEQLFLTGELSRDRERERELAATSDISCLAITLMGEGIDAAQEIAGTMAIESIEPQVNALGYALIEHDELEKALFLFRVNVDKHPSSANAWDSLGECLDRMERPSEALDAYQKSLNLDSANSNARDAIARIKRRLASDNRD